MNKFKIIILILLLFTACSEEEIQLVSNTPNNLPNKNYELNLWSNSSESLESVTIYWNETGNDIFLRNLSTNEIINHFGGTYTYTGLPPEDFLDIEISGEKDDATYIDTIQIFTRSVYSIMHFTYEVEEVMRRDGLYNPGESFTDLDGNNQWSEGEDFIDESEKQYHRRLTWIKTNEPENSFQEYHIFRSEDAEILMNPESCNCEISILNSLLDTTYIDSSSEVIHEPGIYTFYYLVQVSTGEFTKNSYIYNFTGFIQPGSVQFTEGDVSKDKNNYIDIRWDSISNNTYFYKYEVYRASDNGLTDISIVAQIPNFAVEHFQDRSAGSGTTWYYSIAVVDVNGRKSFSNYLSGWSLP
jgi:hypothetical protein